MVTLLRNEFVQFMLLMPLVYVIVALGAAALP